MLELQNVSFRVDDESAGTKEIIKNISLTIPDNRFVVLTGPNGGGKSTLARLIAGIEKPTGGRILYNGKDITDMSITERAKAGIGFAFQQPVRFKGITVRDLIQLAAVRNAINNTGKLIMKNHISHCIVEAIEEDDMESVEALNRAIDRFIK